VGGRLTLAPLMEAEAAFVDIPQTSVDEPLRLSRRAELTSKRSRDEAVGESLHRPRAGSHPKAHRRVSRGERLGVKRERVVHSEPGHGYSFSGMKKPATRAG